jgi:hypothetical protein
MPANKGLSFVSYVYDACCSLPDIFDNVDRRLAIIKDMQLHQAVADYYFDHIAELSSEKRFHWANRLYAWSGEPRALSLLAACRAALVPEPLHDAALERLFRKLAGGSPTAAMHIPAFSLREPYFKTYAPLFGVEAAMFRLRHLETVYGVHGRAAFLRVISTDTLLDLERRLYADPQAVQILSTYAINFSYLLHRVLLEDEGGVDVEMLYGLGGRYDTTDKEQMRLLIYLYTHCIIAETNFYARPVPSSVLPTYRRMLQGLEKLIAENFDGCSLDTKLEFLVCCRLCDYDTPLFARIHQECEQSISPDGTFIVDTLNDFAGLRTKKTFQASEHRNVLFVMSASARHKE